MTSGGTGGEARGFSRRQALRGVVGSAAGTMLWPLAANAELPIADLDRKTAERAADLAAGRELRLRLLCPNGSQGNVLPVVSAFKEMTGIDVVTTVADVDDINAELTLNQMLGEEVHDIALPATFGIPDLAEAGVLLDIGEFAKAYEPSALREGSLYTVGDSYDGRLYGFQADGDAYLMFYNKPWLDDLDRRMRYADRFGYALAIAETWQELDRQMAFFHEPENNRYGGALFRTPTYVAWEWWIRYHAKGFWPFDDDMNPLIDGDAGVSALEDLVGASQFLYPDAPRAGLFDNWRAYAKGNIYANIGWGGTQKYLNNRPSSLRGKLAFSATPGSVIDGKKLSIPYFNWGWTYVVSSRSREPEIAYLFTLFASSPRQSIRSVRDPDGYFDPHRPEHYQDEGIVKAYSQAFLSAHRASMGEAIPDLYLAGHGEYVAALSNGIVATLEGRKKPAVAMSEIAKRWTVITYGLGRTRQLAQWRKLRNKYPPQIAGRLEPKVKAG